MKVIVTGFWVVAAVLAAPVFAAAPRAYRMPVAVIPAGALPVAAASGRAARRGATATPAATRSGSGDEIFADGFDPASRAISPDPAYDGEDAHVLVGADGTVHMVYQATGMESGNSSDAIRYGECAGSCNVAANWTFITLGHYGGSGVGGGPRIALTSSGAPRVMWYSQAAVGDPGNFQIATCSSGCATAGNWLVTAVFNPALTGGDVELEPSTGDTFGIDSQGRLGFFYMTLYADVRYYQCAANCNNPANWSGGSVGQVPQTASMDFDFVGTSPIFADAYDGDDPYGSGFTVSLLGYGGWNGSQWVDTPIFVPSSSASQSFSFAYAHTAAGRPRITTFWYDDAANNDATVDKMVYLACDAATCDGAHFAGIVFSEVGAGFAGMDLQIDAADHPHIVFSGDPDATGLNSQSVSVMACSANCAAAGSTWNVTPLETTSSIPLPTPASDAVCQVGSQWFVGASPVLALHAGSDYVAWEISVLATCKTGTDGGGNPTYMTFTFNGPIRFAIH